MFELLIVGGKHYILSHIILLLCDIIRGVSELNLVVIQVILTGVLMILIKG